MLLQSLLGLKSRHALARDTYRDYVKSTRDFMRVAEQRAIEVSPDQKSLLLNCFRLQNLLIDQRSIRFRFLLKFKSLDCAVFNSLDELDQRLYKNWNAAEQEVLNKSNSHYTGICQEIADIWSKWDAESLTAPLKAVEQDPRYRAARLAIADRTRELQRRIAPS
jgi:hypothetical protein